MPRATQHPKGKTFNFRIDPALKTAFTQATEAEDKPAAQVLRAFMRAYVARRQRRVFKAEARGQSLAIAARASDPTSAEAQSLRDLDAMLDADEFRDTWTA